MAKAPKPGSAGTTSGKEKAREARRSLRLTIKGETREFCPGAMTLQERLVVRKATGLPLEAFLGGTSFGVDSLMVVWWLAARQAGEAGLTLKRVEEAWPDELEEGDVEFEEVDPDEVGGDTEDGLDPQP